jgi:cell wall-associated NlpC family hydrolase
MKKEITQMTTQYEKFIKTKQGVNFRTSPDSSSKANIITYISTVGTILEVLEEVPNITWYKAKLEDGTIGYISSKDIYVEDYEPAWLTKAKLVIEILDKYLGTPYQFGSSRKTEITFDCSDLVKWGYERSLIGVVIPSNSRSQSLVGVQVSEDQLRTGDVLFYDTNRDGIINHVAIYVAPNKIIHTYSTKSDVFDRDFNKLQEDTGGVTYSLYSGDSEALYKPRPVIIKRYIDDNGESLV